MFFVCVITNISGFVSENLQEAQVNVIAQSVCSSLAIYGAFITPRMICAGSLSGGIDSCQVYPKWHNSLSVSAYIAPIHNKCNSNALYKANWFNLNTDIYDKYNSII